MFIWICHFLYDADILKKVSTARTGKKFWKVTQYFYIDNMVKNKWNIPTYKDYIVLKKIYIQNVTALRMVPILPDWPYIELWPQGANKTSFG